MKQACLVLSVWVALFLRAGEEVEVLRKAPVPNSILRQGDALLIRERERFGGRIDLHTRHLARVRDRILKSEQTNWPRDPASQRYRQALEKITDTLLAQKGKTPFRIDWFLHADGSGTVTLGNDDHRIRIDDLPPEYLRGNLLLILQDRFDLTSGQAAAELRRYRD